MQVPSQLDPREKAIVSILKREREAQNLSAAKLARTLGIGRNTIPNLERDEARPTLWVILKMCDGLGLDLAEVVRRAQEQTR